MSQQIPKYPHADVNCTHDDTMPERMQHYRLRAKDLRMAELRLPRLEQC